MDAQEKFIEVSALICESSRAKMLWNLLDGRAYTASELSTTADISPTSASNHLSKLLEAKIIKVEMQGRHRYYSLANADVAYVIEALANLAGNNSSNNKNKMAVTSGVKYCRTCYDHLAGFVGVKVTGALESKRLIKKSEGGYKISSKGWQWLNEFDIPQDIFQNSRRALTRQCLDWSERRPHLAGELGAVLLEKMFERKWFKRVQFSRELIVTSKGKQELDNMLGVSLT